MQTYEIQAWLGDDHGLTTEQIEQLRRAAELIGDRYPDPDDADDREAALTVAYRLLVEPAEQVVADLSGDLTRARLAQVRAMAGLRQAALTVIQDGGKGARGVITEQGFARAAGVDRMLVLDWRGKR